MGKLKSIRRGMDFSKPSSAEQICSCCGEPVSRETLDVEQYRPGAFARLSKENQLRCLDGSEVVVIPRGVSEFGADTWYIRCILYLPIQGADPLRVGVGLWARVAQEDGMRYRKDPNSHKAIMVGTLDGEVPVQIKSKPGKDRPRLVVQDHPNATAWAEHLLMWQREGFPSLEEAHQFVLAFVRPSNSLGTEVLS